jgi:hypothetical protein
MMQTLRSKGVTAMARLVGCAVLILLAPALILGQTPRKSAKPVPATPTECAQLSTLNEVLGKLARLDAASSGNKTFALDVLYQYLIPKKPSAAGNPPSAVRPVRQVNFQGQLASLQVQYQQALATKNPATREQRLARVMVRMQQIQAQMTMQQMKLEQQMIAQANRTFGQLARNAPTVATGYKEFDMEALDKVVIRRLQPPAEYDDKGKLKTYSKDELARLRGKDKSLPGYEASFLDLHNGQLVKIYFSRAKAAKKDKADDKNAKDPDDKDAPPAVKDNKAAITTAPVGLPPVRMILILVDPTGDDGST